MATRTGELELLAPSATTIQANIKNNTFFRVLGKRTSKNNLSLGGAEDIWKKYPDFIYEPFFRLAGTPDNVRTVLLDLTDNNVAKADSLIDKAITSENYDVPLAEGGQMETFDQIYQEYKASRVLAKKNKIEGYNAAGQPIPTLDILPAIKEALKEGEVTEKTKPLAPSRKRVTSTKATQNLLFRMEHLPAGKVLNVSKLDKEGKGARTINTPSNQSKFVGFDIGQLPIVSDNLEGYTNAIRELEMNAQEEGRKTEEGGPVVLDEYIPRWQEAHASKVTSRSRRAAPVSTRVKGLTGAAPARRIVSARPVGEIPLAPRKVTPRREIVPTEEVIPRRVSSEQERAARVPLPVSPPEEIVTPPRQPSPPAVTALSQLKPQGAPSPRAARYAAPGALPTTMPRLSIGGAPTGTSRRF